ncbi:MAG: oligosaccharide flippase family protein [Candidatus Accumulibacter sp.]|jgi:O-antigen/teichoic acid export membrane protein|nr:oligosaccharide flippase family protein [Accumulibacter sp.]
MSQVRRAIYIQLVATNGATAVHFIVSIVLARLLSPHDIGIFSITVVVTNIAHIFRDFGISSYIKTVKECSPNHIRAANGLLMASSWSMGTLLFVVSDSLAVFYGEYGIGSVMKVLSIGFFFIPFGSITLALLGRSLNADAAARISVFGVSSYAISVLSLAYFDFGYMSMAWANLINIMVTAVTAAFFRPPNSPWLPSFKGWGSVANFGAGAILGNFISTINNSIPEMILGKIGGSHDVGIFSRANATTNMFQQIAGPSVNYATLPYLAKEYHENRPLSPIVLQAICYLTAMGWPALVFTGIFADDIIILLYGEKWAECIPLVSLMCSYAALGMLTNFNNASFLALGRPYLSVVTETVLLLARLIMIFFIYDKTLVSFVFALLMASIVTYPIHLFMQKKYLNILFADIASSTAKSAFVGICCGMTAFLMHKFLSDIEYVIIKLSVASFIMALVWIFLIRATSHPILDEVYAVLRSAREKIFAKSISDNR